MFNTSHIGSVLGGELVDRVLATGMELAIAHLVVSAIADVSELHARTSAARLARACFYLVGVAQVPDTSQTLPRHFQDTSQTLPQTLPRHFLDTS